MSKFYSTIYKSSIKQNSLSSTFFRIKYHNLLRRVFEGIFKLILGVLLVKIYGINGIIIGSIISSLIFTIYGLNILSSQFVGTLK